jgi:hypothetical protein
MGLAASSGNGGASGGAADGGASAGAAASARARTSRAREPESCGDSHAATSAIEARIGPLCLVTREGMLE